MSEIPSLLTQLLGQPEVFTIRLAINLGLFMKALECYWTFCRSLHPLMCAAKSENKDSWIVFAYSGGSESQVSYMKAQKYPGKIVLTIALSSIFCRSMNQYFLVVQEEFLRYWRICYSLCPLCSFTPMYACYGWDWCSSNFNLVWLSWWSKSENM